MELFLLAVLIMIFFFLFKVTKDKDGNFRVESRIAQLPNPKINQAKVSVKTKIKQFFQSKLILNLLVVVLVLAELINLVKLFTPAETLIKIRASQLIPDKFNPIARFAANMDWDKQTIALDASMSKAYQDQIVNYIWRIDDGTSLVGVKNLTHTFTHPGYYYIQLSVVDQDNQSDSATCVLLIPPQDLEQVAVHEKKIVANNQLNQETQDIDYDWAPKGTFFNYSKMDATERSYANLKSRYIESGCGYSNRTYNTNKNSYVDFLHNSKVQAAIVQIFRTVITGVIILPVIYLVLRSFLKKFQH